MPQKKSAKKTGYSTDVEVLQELSKIHPVPTLLLHYRELFKLKSTYIDALPEYVNKKTGKIHTTFSQTSVATGRLASFDPNLQNIPTDTRYHIHIRSAFKPDPGHVFLSADYSQIELGVLAYLFSRIKHYLMPLNKIKIFMLKLLQNFLILLMKFSLRPEQRQIR